MRQAVLIGAISTMLSFSTQAAELVDLRVRSYLNEPLQLELGLSEIGTSDTLAVKAGTLDLYRKAGRIQPPEVLGLRVDVIGTNPYRLIKNGIGRRILFPDGIQKGRLRSRVPRREHP